MSMKILITGAGGFIGGFIVEEALSRGYETWAGVRKTTSREHLSDPAIRFIDFNYGNKKILTDQLLSHKGEYGAWDYIVYNLGVTKCKNPDDFDRINYGFVKNFTEALVETEMVPKQFIMTSSLGAWGVGDEKNFTPIRPTDTPHPNTRYGKSKLKAERHLESLEGFPYVVMRPTGVYGPYERLLPDDEKYQIRIRFHRRVQTSTHHLHLRERFGTSYLQSHRPGSRSAGVLPLGRKSIHFVPVSPICSDRFGKAQGCPCQNSGVVALGRIGHCRKRSYRAGKNQHIKSG